MQRAWRTFATVCALLTSTAGYAADDLTLEQRVQRAQESLIEFEEKGASGITLIAHRGSTLLESGFGSASCREDEPVTPAHHFMIGSITKDMTQLLAYVLAEREVLSLSDTVNQYFPQVGETLGAITVEQLTTHTAGLPNLIDDKGRRVLYSIAYDYRPVTRDQLIERISKTKLKHPPGSKREYSNLGYQLLAAIFEVASERRFEDLLAKYIYQPAEMENTGYWFADKAQRRFVDGCRRFNRHWGNPIDDAMWGPESASWNLKGAGGIISTAGDLARFFDGISHDVYFTSSDTASRYKANRLRHSDFRGQRVMSSAGSNGIFNAVVFWLEEDQFTLVMITNRAAHQAEDDMVQSLIRLFPPGSLPTDQ